MDEQLSYTRGGPVNIVEAVLLGEFVWKTADGRLFPLSHIEDDHLLNIELHLMGRSSYKTPEGFGPGNDRWERQYEVIRGEIDRRGLILKEATGAPIKKDEEDFYRG